LLGLGGHELGPIASADVDDHANLSRRKQVAQLAQRAENGFVGVPSGALDQTASMCCARGCALFFDIRTGQLEQIAFDAEANGMAVLVIDTRVSRSLSAIAHSPPLGAERGTSQPGAADYGDRRRACERAAALLGTTSLRDVKSGDLVAAQAQLPAELGPLVRHVVTENARVHETVALLRAHRVAEIGPLLTASHVSLRDDYRVSSPELDLAVDTALAHGALGARMTGAGFGGSAIALVSESNRSAIERALTDAFARRGWTSPRLFTAVPSAGAGRDDPTP
jgi:galactokinase